MTEPSTWAGTGTVFGLGLFAVPVDAGFYRGALWAAALFCAVLAILMREKGSTS